MPTKPEGRERPLQTEKVPCSCGMVPRVGKFSLKHRSVKTTQFIREPCFSQSIYFANEESSCGQALIMYIDGKLHFIVNVA